MLLTCHRLPSSEPRSEPPTACTRIIARRRQHQRSRSHTHPQPAAAGAATQQGQSHRNGVAAHARARTPLPFFSASQYAHGPLFLFRVPSLFPGRPLFPPLICSALRHACMHARTHARTRTHGRPTTNDAACGLPAWLTGLLHEGGTWSVRSPPRRTPLLATPIATPLQRGRPERSGFFSEGGTPPFRSFSAAFPQLFRSCSAAIPNSSRSFSEQRQELFRNAPEAFPHCSRSFPTQLPQLLQSQSHMPPHSTSTCLSQPRPRLWSVIGFQSTVLKKNGPRRGTDATDAQSAPLAVASVDTPFAPSRARRRRGGCVVRAARRRDAGATNVPSAPRAGARLRR